jgi:histidyl-tRNA synthetase
MDVFMIQVGDQVENTGLVLAESIRDQMPELKLQVHCGGGSFKSQFKKADKSGAEIALILGENEVANGEVGIKPLRSQEEQHNIPQQQLVEYLKLTFNSKTIE